MFFGPADFGKSAARQMTNNPYQDVKLTQKHLGITKLFTYLTFLEEARTEDLAAASLLSSLSSSSDEEARFLRRLLAVERLGLLRWGLLLPADLNRQRVTQLKHYHGF